MTVTESAVDHHSHAATHHERAAHFHREASRHYQIGKDYAHAAHMALLAQGHELHAAEHSRAASAVYAIHATSPLPGYLTRSTNTLKSAAVTVPLNLNGAAHHIAAADHSDAASQHHEQARTHNDAGHNIRACYETKKAIDHGKHAGFHTAQAALQHLSKFGKDAEDNLI